MVQGYHVQVTARSDRDLTPEGIVQKVADSSGAKYGGGSAPSTSSSINNAPPPPASKPVFMPSKVGGGGGGGFNPLGSRSRGPPSTNQDADGDGWGSDAPQVTRSQLEKVESAYKPTKVNMAELTSQKQQPSRFQAPQAPASNGSSDVVKGTYQPIGKVDLAAIRREAQEKGQVQKDDRPTTVKGSYEPVGKVDIAAIRAKAQGAPSSVSSPPVRDSTGPSESDESERPKSLADRSAAFTQSERLTSLPKPKVANRFGSQASTFTGTRAPAPGGFEAKPTSTAVPVGSTSKTFADEGGKTPAQIWAEKKARERGTSNAGDSQPASPIPSQQSGQWQSGYTGKSWGQVQTTRTGTSSIGAQDTGPEPEQEEEAPSAPSGGVSAIRDRFKAAPPMGAPRDAEDDDEPSISTLPPPMDFSSKPNAGVRGVPMPGLPQRPPQEEVPEDVAEEEHQDLPPPPPRPRTPEDEEELEPPMSSGSPVRIAMPVSRTAQPAPIEAAEEEPPAMPIRSLHQAVSNSQPQDAEEEDDGARGAAQAAAASTFGAGAEHAAPGASIGGKRAIAQYDYEKAEDNELELREGEEVTNIEMVDEDWWMGQNSRGESGLFPSNYVELVEGGNDGHAGPAPAEPEEDLAPPPGPPQPHGGAGPTATAQYDYEAAEENELSFPDGAKITNLVSTNPSMNQICNV